MRLVVELLIIAGLVYLGWTTTFKDRVDRTKAEITSALNSMGGSLQKHQDKSVRRYWAGPHCLASAVAEADRLSTERINR